MNFTKLSSWLYKKIRNNLIKSGLLILLIGAGLMNFTATLEKNVDCMYYTVTTEKLNVRNNAGANANITGTVKKSDRLCIDRLDGEWAHIKNGNWVNAKYLNKKEYSIIYEFVGQVLFIPIIKFFIIIYGLKVLMFLFKSFWNSSSSKSSYKKPSKNTPLKEETQKIKQEERIIIPKSVQKIMINSPQKVCALCQFWAGQRTLNSVRNMVSFDNNTTGKCIGPVGFPKYNQEVRGMVHCNKFLKWNV